jgi:hypothetical protein
VFSHGEGVNGSSNTVMFTTYGLKSADLYCMFIVFFDSLFLHVICFVFLIFLIIFPVSIFESYVSVVLFYKHST